MEDPVEKNTDVMTDLGINIPEEEEITKVNLMDDLEDSPEIMEMLEEFEKEQTSKTRTRNLAPKTPKTPDECQAAIETAEKEIKNLESKAHTEMEKYTGWIEDGKRRIKKAEETFSRRRMMYLQSEDHTKEGLEAIRDMQKAALKEVEQRLANGDFDENAEFSDDYKKGIAKAALAYKKSMRIATKDYLEYSYKRIAENIKGEQYKDEPMSNSAMRIIPKIEELKTHIEEMKALKNDLKNNQNAPTSKEEANQIKNIVGAKDDIDDMMNAEETNEVDSILNEIENEK